LNKPNEDEPCKRKETEKHVSRIHLLAGEAKARKEAEEKVK